MICRRRAPSHLLPVIVLLACLGVSGCSSSSSPRAPVPVRRDALRIPVYDHLITADPALARSPSSRMLVSLLFSGLVKFGPDLHVIPDLAVSIPTISDDGRTYTFTVRQDARFADGHHCTAADIAYSLARALSPEVHSPTAYRYLGQIEGAGGVERGKTLRLSGVHVSGRLTIRIRLNHPDSAFLEKLAFPVASVVDRRTIRFSPWRDWLGRPAGTGPWALWRKPEDGSLELRPRHHYYGGSLQLKELVLIPVHNEASALDLYRKGLLDIAHVSTAQYHILSSRTDFHESASLDAYYALPDPDPAAAALAATLNRDRLIHDATPALSSLDAIVPPAVPDYVSSPPSMDSVSAGPIPPITVQLGSPTDPAARLLRRALYRQWPAGRGSGVTVRIVHVASLLPDPAVWLRVVLQQTDSTWYRNMLMHNARLTNDPVSRMSSYSRAENWAIDKALVIPLASGNIAYLMKPRVQSLQVTPIGIMPENNNWSSVSVT